MHLPSTAEVTLDQQTSLVPLGFIFIKIVPQAVSSLQKSSFDRDFMEMLRLLVNYRPPEKQERNSISFSLNRSFCETVIHNNAEMHNSLAGHPSAGREAH